MLSTPAARPRRPSLCRDRARSPRTPAIRTPAPGAASGSSPPSGMRARCSAGPAAWGGHTNWTKNSVLPHHLAAAQFDIRPDRSGPRSHRPDGTPPLKCARRAWTQSILFSIVTCTIGAGFLVFVPFWTKQLYVLLKGEGKTYFKDGKVERLVRMHAVVRSKHAVLEPSVLQSGHKRNYRCQKQHNNIFESICVIQKFTRPNQSGTLQNQSGMTL